MSYKPLKLEAMSLVVQLTFSGDFKFSTVTSKIQI